MDEALRSAQEREKDYDWLGAAEFHEKALGLVPETDSLKRGDIHERIGYSLFLAARQANNVEDFKGHMRRSAASYDKAARLLESAEPARGLNCEALARYSDFWLVEAPSKKKQLLDDCWRLMKRAFEGFEARRDWLGCAKTFRSLSFCIWEENELEGDWGESKQSVEEALKYGQKTISMLTNSQNADELAWTYCRTAFLMAYRLDYFDERRAEFTSLISTYLEKAANLTEKTEDAHLLFYVNLALCYNEVWVNPDWIAARRHVIEVIRQSERSRDHDLMGIGLIFMANGLNYEALTEEDPEEFEKKIKESTESFEKSISNFLLVCEYGRAASGYEVIVENDIQSVERETDFQRRRARLQRAVKLGLNGLEYANLSGSPVRIMGVCHGMSKALFFLSENEPNFNEKKRLLEEAANLREKTIKIGSQLFRSEDWNNGVYQNYMALINADLAKIEESEDNKRHLLEEAVQSMEKCLKICTNALMNGNVSPLPRNFAALGMFHDWFGQVLNQLHSLTENAELIDRSIQVYESAAKTYQKAAMPSRVAEAFWRVARLYERRGEYLKAADSFEQASRNYQLVAEKIPQLKDFSQDQALYMQAWDEIEKARHHHARQEYGLAREHYEKAAEVHKSLKKWSYLGSNYSAWAHIESAEDLSRREQSEDAIKTFDHAAKLFTETRESLEAQLRRIADEDEKQMATRILEATDTRHDYCMGRIALEEARILDKKGDHYASSEKYGLAAETFEKITQTQESEQDQKEFRLITTLSRAWQKMTQAEAETSPKLYLDAAQLFEEAKELSPSEKAKTLAIGHSRFCRALEAGTKFADTRDPASYAQTMQHLESAANYYLKAGFANASEYAKATELLFDAYMHMDEAKKEKSPEKKARLYAMAEKVLQSAAGAFTKAEHPEKREQVLRLLEKVKEERELSASLSEVLHAPAIVSTTTAFSTPNPTHENAVGLERFEHADIQANMITRQKELKVGESLRLEIELVNAGKGPALLTKITEVIPEGFELTEKPEMYRVEDSYLNMKGKRLDPLKMEDVKLVLKPRVQGVFPLKPKILYLDENGRYKSHEPEPITITVKELGIKGWLKGER